MDKREDIVTRFPPSPTGYLHVGGARTAIFNWLYARHTGGRFVLRIEDTDTQRSTKESTDAILEALEWLAIDWDEGPYFQTERFHIYDTYIEKLIESGNAYYCSCSPEEIEKMRETAQAEGRKPRYDGRCREKGLGPGPGRVVRFKSPEAGNTVIEDVIKGGIVFNNSELDDFIIKRSDGTPTYNFVVVIDDITMGINTVIRGDDHVNNTPKQIQIYKALGEPLPVYGHVPMVLGSDRTRLSKRHGAMSVTAYREMGFLPDALVNYLVRLGWSFGDQEFFTREELIEKFSLEHIGRSAGVFDPDKLLALNGDHIQATPVEKLAELLIPFLDKVGIEAENGPFLQSVVETLKQRSKTLKEMAESAAFYFTEEITYDEKAARKFLKPNALEPMKLLVSQLEQIEILTEKAVENAFVTVMESTGMKLGKIAQPVRVALTGRTFSPGIFEIIEIIGKQSVLKRLQAAIRFIEEKGK